MFLYLTADSIGTPTGGGAVTFHELQALQSLGNVDVLSRDDFNRSIIDPFEQDQFFLDILKRKYHEFNAPKLGHCYSGCLTKSIEFLQSIGSIVTYTAAAHSIEESRKEHEALGLEFNYPHLTDPELWRKYVGGYLLADALIVPSTHSERVMRSFGANKRTVVIPHGCELPTISEPASYPVLFTLGYMGCVTGPDKGIRYLLEAWKKLNYKDAMLVLAGRDSTHPFVHKMIELFGGGCIQLAGWQNHVSSFYNRISVLIQPSVSEGFGMEVVESMSYAKPILCSTGAGASDVVTPNCGLLFQPRDIEEICNAIEHYRRYPKDVELDGSNARIEAHNYTWDKIRNRYVELWKSLLD